MEWVYFNIYTSGKDKIKESTPYRNKADTYKFNKYLVDGSYENDTLKGEYFKNECRNLKKPRKDKACDTLKTIKDVYDANKSYYTENNKKRIDNIKNELISKFNNPSGNPGYNSNGNLDDLNRNDGEWPRVRTYLRLQDADSKLPMLIKKMGSGQTFEVVYKKDKIMDYFKSNPDKLPKTVPKYP